MVHPTLGLATLAAPVTVEVTDALTGTATSGSDYGSFGVQAAIFGVGSGDGDLQPVALTVIDDLLIEDDETVDLTIGSVIGPALIGSPSDHTVTIEDDENNPPTVGTDQTSVTVDEGQEVDRGATMSRTVEPMTQPKSPSEK